MNSDAYDVDELTASETDDKEKKPSCNTKGICVVLEEDYSKTDVKDLLMAIKRFRGVLTAEFLDVGFDDHCNRSRMKLEIRKEIEEGLKF